MKQWLAVFALLAGLSSSLAGCASARGPRQLEAVPQAGAPAESNWSRVHELPQASKILVTAWRRQSGDRYFMSADEETLTVLNLAHPMVLALPAASIRVLRDIASDQPEYFLSTGQRGTFAKGDVRVGPEGVFVADRKVAGLEEIVERIRRDDVIEIRGRVIARGSLAGSILGGWLGFAVGVIPSLGGASQAIGSLLLVGSVAGGGFLGFHWSSHATDGLIYRAP